MLRVLYVQGLKTGSTICEGGGGGLFGKPIDTAFIRGAVIRKYYMVLRGLAKPGWLGLDGGNKIGGVSDHSI